MARMFEATLEEFKARIHGYLNRNVAVILTYHSIVDCPLPFDLWTHMQLPAFEEHMAFLHRTANVVPLAEIVGGVRRKRLPKYAVAITFDDGFGNNFTRAYPVLRRFRLPATIFVSTGFIGRQELFWPERLAYQVMKTSNSSMSFAGQILSLKNAADRIQANSVLKENLKKKHPIRLEADLQEIERKLGVPYVREDSLFREWLPLDWVQIRQMAASGIMDFGGHTADHHILSRLSDQEAEHQIQSCRKALDHQLGGSKSLWAYPNGTLSCFNKAHQLMLNRNGFDTTFTAVPEYVSIDSDPAILGRWGVGSTANLGELRDTVVKRGRWSSLRGKGRLRTACFGNHGHMS